MRLAHVNSESGDFEVYSQFTGELLIEQCAGPDVAFDKCKQIQDAIRKAETIAYRRGLDDMEGEAIKASTNLRLKQS